MDLNRWGQNQDKIIRLKGEWIFYPNTLFSDLNDETKGIIKQVPHWWEEDAKLGYSPYGYATYVLDIKGLKQDENYAIDIIDVVTSYNLYVNDKIVASNGVVGINKDSSVPQWRQETGIFQADRNGCAKIAIEISNYDYYRGGLWDSPRIGKVQDILNNVQKEKVKQVVVSALIMSCAFFSIGLYMVYRKSRTTLFFALFCFTTAVYNILIGQRVINYFLPAYNWQVMVRLEYLSGYLMLPFFVLFFINLIMDETDMTCMKRIFYYFIASCFIISVIPYQLYSSFLSFYKWFSFLMAICFAYILIKAVIKKRHEYELILFAMVVMVLAILKENTIGGTVSWIPYATLVFVFCFSYITFKHFLELVREKDVLEAKLMIDPLTRLFNRNYLKSIVLKSIVGNNNFKRYFLFMDIDDFKQINDNYGHDIGDFILREVGIRFHKVLNSEDIVCRYGGDEFFCIVRAENIEHIERIAKGIINEVHAPFEKEEMSYNVGISIGICPENEKIYSLEEYIKLSDAAMYQAKKDGKSRYFINEQI